MKSILSARKKKAILSAIAAGICFGGTLLPKTAEAVERKRQIIRRINIQPPM